MISSESPAAVVKDLQKSFGPVEVTERMILLDVLRGFAIFGILVANNVKIMDLYLGLLPSAIERFFANLVEILIRDKFWPQFALLFGIGFAVQLERAASRNASILAPYIRRLLFMALIGGALKLFIEVPQLIQLAIAGVPMLIIGYILRHRPQRILMFCIVAVCIIGLSVSIPQQFQNQTARQQTTLTKEEITQRIEKMHIQSEQNNGHAREWKLEKIGSHIQMSIQEFRDLPLDIILARRLHIFLLFYMLIGVLIWRSRFLHEANKRKRVFLLIFAVSLPISITAAIFVKSVQIAGFQYARLGMGNSPSFLCTLMYWPMAVVASLGMALSYVAGLALLMQRAIWARVLMIFSPVGRMAFTNYVLQALLPAIVFGLYTPAIIPTANISYVKRIVVLIVIFGIQVILSHIWLKFYRFGPLEWVLRSLTYWRRQPMRNR